MWWLMSFEISLFSVRNIYPCADGNLFLCFFPDNLPPRLASCVGDLSWTGDLFSSVSHHSSIPFLPPVCCHPLTDSLVCIFRIHGPTLHCTHGYPLRIRIPPHVCDFCGIYPPASTPLAVYCIGINHLHSQPGPHLLCCQWSGEDWSFSGKISHLNSFALLQSTRQTSSKA